MAERGGDSPRSEESVPPTDFAKTPPPIYPGVVDTGYLFECMMQVQKSIGELSAKADRLILDVHSHGEKIDGVRHQIAFVRGAMWVIGFVVVVVAAAATWYFTGKLSITVKPLG